MNNINCINIKCVLLFITCMNFPRLSQCQLLQKEQIAHQRDIRIRIALATSTMIFTHVSSNFNFAFILNLFFQEDVLPTLHISNISAKVEPERPPNVERPDKQDVPAKSSDRRSPPDGDAMKQSVVIPSFDDSFNLLIDQNYPVITPAGDGSPPVGTPDKTEKVNLYAAKNGCTNLNDATGSDRKYSTDDEREHVADDGLPDELSNISENLPETSPTRMLKIGFSQSDNSMSSANPPYHYGNQTEYTDDSDSLSKENNPVRARLLYEIPRTMDSDENLNMSFDISNDSPPFVSQSHDGEHSESPKTGIGDDHPSACKPDETPDSNEHSNGTRPLEIGVPLRTMTKKQYLEEILNSDERATLL